MNFGLLITGTSVIVLDLYKLAAAFPVVGGAPAAANAVFVAGDPPNTLL